MIRATNQTMFISYKRTFLVIASCIASQFENFSCKVFEDSCEVDYILVDCLQRNRVSHTWSTSTNSLGVVASSQKSVNSTNREGKTSFGRSRLRALATGGSFSSRFSSRHGSVYRLMDGKVCSCLMWTTGVVSAVLVNAEREERRAVGDFAVFIQLPSCVGNSLINKNSN